MQEKVWEREYREKRLVTGGNEPQASVRNFFRWLRRERGIPLENLNLLDLGCGNGKNSNYLCSQDMTNRATGFDISDTALTEARNNAYEMEVEEQTQYIKHDIGSPYPLPQQTFDIALDVTSSNSLDEKGREMYLRETHRVLRDGGYFFVRALCKDGDANASQLLKNNPGPQKDTYILPLVGLVERVFSKEDFTATYSGGETPLFNILSLEKETHYTRFAGRSYKRNFWIAYLQKK